MPSFQSLVNPEDIKGTYTRKVAMHCGWMMFRKGFKPQSIINAGVGCPHEFSIWRWLFPEIPVMAVDVRLVHPRYRWDKLKYVQAALDNKSSSAMYCAVCGSLSCKAQSEHESAGAWREVQAHTMDELASDLPVPHFMWMDIEGGEIRALQGAVKTLQNTGWLCIELVKWIPNYRRNVLRLLKRQGFVLEVLFSKDGLFRNTKLKTRGRK